MVNFKKLLDNPPERLPDWVCPYCGETFSGIAKEFHLKNFHPDKINESDESVLDFESYFCYHPDRKETGCCYLGCPRKSSKFRYYNAFFKNRKDCEYNKKPQ